MDYFTCESIALLLKWCKVVCATYGFRVNNFTLSFSDGRALCLLINFYLPQVLSLSEIHTTTADMNMSSILDTTQVCSQLGLVNWLPKMQICIKGSPLKLIEI